MSDVINFMETIINYIEDHLLLNFDLHELSRCVHYSKYHMSRLFKKITGFGIMEYVTARRLSLSADDLLYAHKSIDCIANYYCFSSVQSYIRAFKRVFSITPLVFRKKPCELKIYERYNVELLKRFNDGCIIFPEIKILPAFSIAGIEYKINITGNEDRNVTIPYIRDFFFDKSRLIKNAVSYSKYIGYNYIPNCFFDMEWENRYVFYTPSIIVNSESDIPSFMKENEISTNKYAIFKYVGFHSINDISGWAIYDIYDYIHLKWMPSVKYKENDRFSFELIDYKQCNDKYCEIKFYIPLI